MALYELVLRIFLVMQYGFYLCQAKSTEYTNDAAAKGGERLCKDKLRANQCSYYKRYGGCKTHASRMKNLCPRTCGFCGVSAHHCRLQCTLQCKSRCKAQVITMDSSGCNSSFYGCCIDGVTPAAGPNLQGCEDACHDRFGEAFCKTIERLGGCNGGQNSIAMKCMKTCRMCRPCKDKHFSKCQTWKRFYGCSATLVRMNNHCRKTCGYCGKNDPCYGHSCPKHHHCRVNKNMQPLCACDFHCREDDNKTGTLCGRDGVQYKNLCELRKASCRLGKAIAVKKYGPCREPVYPRSCSESFKEHARCDLWVKHQACRTHKKLLSKWCPRSCGFCKAAFDPYSIPCYNTMYGCCPDGKTPCRTPGCEHCPGKNACADKTKPLCRRFTHACGMDRNRSVMKILCTETCQYCVRSQPIFE